MPAIKKSRFHIGLFQKGIVVVVVSLAFSMLTPRVARAQAATADVQTPAMKKGALYNAGQTAFQKGDYATAITNFEALLAMADKDDILEAPYFYLGASYFNTKDYGKAIEIFKKFEAAYPKSGRLLEVLFATGQAEYLNGDYAGAIEYFKKVEPTVYHDISLYYQGISSKAADKPDDAIAAFEKLITPEIRSSDGANGAILLVELYAKRKDFTKATEVIRQLRKKMMYVTNIMNLNAQAIELGDGLVEDELYPEALLCYRMVRSKDDVIAFQTAKLAYMAQKIDQNMAAIHADPPHGMALNAENTQLKAAIAAGTKMMEEYKNAPDTMPAVLLRIGRCFYQQEKFWEAIVADNELLTRYPDSDQYESGLFAITVACAKANRPAATKQYADEYLKKYPQGKNIQAVSYLVGAAMMQASDFEGAAAAFTKALKEQPDSKYKEEMEMQLGNAHFSLGKFDLATADYSKYKTDFPAGGHIEEVIYRIALSSLFAGQYEDAMKEVTDYVTTYPKGNFIADARYRLGVCKYAASLYPEVIADCRSWEKDYPKNPMLGEVLALLGDSLDAVEPARDDEAIQVYIRAAQVANTDEVLEYSLSSAEKLLQKKGDWEKIGQMYEEFVKTHPEHPLVVTAVYWIGKAKVHDGKADEAKIFIADNIKKYIDDPRRDAVEQLITQLAGLCVRKKKPPEPSPSPSPAVASGTDAVAVATPPPTPTPSPTPDPDPGAELDKLLGSAETDTSPTAKARILFAKAELAFMRRQIPEQEKNYAAIAAQFKPEDLPSIILGQVGDYLLFKKENDKAAAYFQYLMDEYPKSDVQDYAYNGLGQIAFQNKDYEKALKYFSDGIDKGYAAQKFKDLTLGEARSLFQLGKYEESKKQFELVAGNKDWRGDPTAESLCSMGDIEMKENKFPEAIAYYQRVYVAYQRYLPWVAKAYINSGDCFERLGKLPEAVKTYQEMLANEKLASFPEADVARKRLEVLGSK